MLHQSSASRAWTALMWSWWALIMLNQSTFGGLGPATSALLPGFPNNTGLVRTLLPAGHHPNVTLGLEVRHSAIYIDSNDMNAVTNYRSHIMSEHTHSAVWEFGRDTAVCDLFLIIWCKFRQNLSSSSFCKLACWFIAEGKASMVACFS